MRYDLVLCDFDGTLLKSDDTISARTVQAIRAFTDCGGTFAVSTGRSFASIRQRLRDLGIRGDVPVLCCQGAVMRTAESGRTLYEIPLRTCDAVAFLQKAESLDQMCQFYTADEVYAPSLNDRNREYFRINRIQPVSVGKASAYAEKCGEAILKLLCVIDPADRARMLAAFAGQSGVKVFTSHPFLIEAVSEHAGKGNGLMRACDYFGIPRERSVAIGDEGNDVEMIAVAGLGIAMGNAVAEAKAAARYVTDTCDNDGVAKVLEKIIEESI